MREIPSTIEKTRIIIPLQKHDERKKANYLDIKKIIIIFAVLKKQAYLHKNYFYKSNIQSNSV